MRRALAAFVLVATASTVPGQEPAHDLAFWRALAAETAPPPADVLPARVREVGELLGSPHPELRDDVAYTLLVRWIYRDRCVPPALRRELLAAWTANLRRDIGSTGTDAVLRRSFSALALAVLAALDLEEPWLEDAEYRALLAAALDYLRDEMDVRGFDSARGWIHSVAHTADLLKFLARSPRLRAEEQTAILDAVTAKLTAVEAPLACGEDERLARAVLSIAARGDRDDAAFAAWLPRVWPAAAEPPSVATLARADNRRHVVTSLACLLHATDAENLQKPRAAVDELLRQRLR